MMKRISSLGLLVACGALAACATSSPSRPLDEVEELVKERSGVQTRLREPAAEGSALAGPLSAEDAARLALARNAAFKSKLEEVGLAQADLAQAGLLENPRLHGSLRYPSDGGQAGRELGISVNLLELFELPLRRRVAASRLEQAKFKLGQDVLALGAEAKGAFYAYQAAEGRLALRRSDVESRSAALELAGRQREAGNVSRLELASERAAYHEAAAALASEEAEAAAAREQLGLLMGLQDRRDWTVEGEPPALPETDPSADEIETAALSQRWDLQAARRDPQVLAQALRLERGRLFSSVDVGIDSERDYDGRLGYGPSFEFGVPLFDRRQAAAARLRAERRRSLVSADALEAAIRMEIRTASVELAAARKTVADREALVPLRREILQETLKNYNFMLKGAFELLEAKRRELDASASRLEALRNYWTKRAELERAAGGKLPSSGGR